MKDKKDNVEEKNAINNRERHEECSLCERNGHGSGKDGVYIVEFDKKFGRFSYMADEEDEQGDVLENSNVRGTTCRRPVRPRYQVDRSTYTEAEFEEKYEKTPSEAVSSKTRAHRFFKQYCLCSRRRLQKFIVSFFPFLTMLRKYSISQDLQGDATAGFTVAIMHVPQGMGYAMLASVAPVYGLYVSFFAPLVYFFFGTSRHISIGTFAVTSLMVGTVVEKYAHEFYVERNINGSFPNITNVLLDNNYAENVSIRGKYSAIQVAGTVTILAGFIQVAMGLLRLGSLTTFLSDELVSAFTTGAAVHVFTSQVKYVLGLKIPTHSGVFKIFYTYAEVFKNLKHVNAAAVVISIICIFTLVIVKLYADPWVKSKIKMPVPMELFLVVVITGIFYGAKLEQKFDVEVVGNIPIGMPPPSFPPTELYKHIIGDAFAIAVVAFTASLSMAKLLAKKWSYEVNSTQELFALGVTNVFTSCFSGFLSAASLSRSLVQESVGGRTQITSIISCTFLILVLLLLGPLFESLPNAVLASIILVALKGMFVQYCELPKLWKLSRPDFLIWIVTWSATVFLDVTWGLVIGVCWSLLTVVWRSQQPAVIVLGQLPTTNIYKDVSEYQQVEEIPGIKIIKFEASPYFANVEFFRSKVYSLSGVNPLNLKQLDIKNRKLRNQEEKAKSNNNSLNRLGIENNALELNEPVEVIMPITSTCDLPFVIILDCGKFTYVDVCGANALKQMVQDYAQLGILILLSECSSSVQKTLNQAGFFDDVSNALDVFHLTLHDAVLHACESIRTRSRQLSDAENLTSEDDI